MDLNRTEPAGKPLSTLEHSACHCFNNRIRMVDTQMKWPIFLSDWYPDAWFFQAKHIKMCRGSWILFALKILLLQFGTQIGTGTRYLKFFANRQDFIGLCGRPIAHLAFTHIFICFAAKNPAAGCKSGRKIGHFIWVAIIRIRLLKQWHAECSRVESGFPAGSVRFRST